MKECAEPEIRDTVRRLVLERVDEAPLDDSASLLATTNLDSLGLVTLLVAIEEEFDVIIDVVTVDPESLMSISGLTNHLSTLV